MCTHRQSRAAAAMYSTPNDYMMPLSPSTPGMHPRLATAPGGYQAQQRPSFTPALDSWGGRPNTVPMNHLFGHSLHPTSELTLLPTLDTNTVRLSLSLPGRGGGAEGEEIVGEVMQSVERVDISTSFHQLVTLRLGGRELSRHVA